MNNNKKKVTKKPRKSLGKGLGAILKDNNLDDDIARQQADVIVASQNLTLEVPLIQIGVNPWQPRHNILENELKELSESIKKHGLIQPVTLKRINDQSYQLISGERRLQASKLAGMKTITAYIRSANEQQMLEMALIENIQREDLNPIEIALSLQQLITECKLTQESVGEQVGKKRATITNYLRLLKLPEIIQDALKVKTITMGHAKVILGLENIDMQIDCFKEVVTKQLSVRQCEKLATSYSENKMNPVMSKQNNDKLSIQANAVVKDLSSHFGTKIKLLINKNKKGELKIPFTSMDDLNRIIEILKP